MLSCNCVPTFSLEPPGDMGASLAEEAQCAQRSRPSCQLSLGSCL